MMGLYETRIQLLLLSATLFVFCTRAFVPVLPTTQNDAVPRHLKCRRRRPGSLAWVLSGSAGNSNMTPSFYRRVFLQTLPWIALVPPAAFARGLVQFPCVKPLLNKYHFMAAGTSLLTEEGIWSTNPLFLTNREDALSPTGEEQVLTACEELRSLDTLPTVVKYSLAASCIDTSNIIGRELKLGRDRLIPEFTFMDPRAVGRWDMSRAEETKSAVWAMDADEAGPDGVAGRPPPNEDGTPHETLADQAIRLRQLLSVLETQYSGDTILLIFPDGTGPALLSAMIAGLPYNRVHELEFQPGEIRLDVTRHSTLALWNKKKDDPTYLATIQRGRENLKSLRSNREIVSLKDQMMEEERIAIDKEFEKRQAEKNMLREKEREKLRKRQEELEAAAQDSKGDLLPFAVGAGAIAVAGAAMADRLSSSNESTRLENGEEKVISTSTITESEDATSAPKNRPLLANRNEAAVDDFARSLTDQSTVQIAPPVPTPVDPYEAAQKAMQEYLEQDDGAEAWLESLAEIKEEQELSSDDEPSFQ